MREAQGNSFQMIVNFTELRTKTNGCDAISHTVNIENNKKYASQPIRAYRNKFYSIGFHES